MCQLLEGRNPKQLFTTYERLEEMAEKLHLDSVSMFEQLVIAGQGQSLLLSKMDADLTILHDTIYCKEESVCLSNQVSNWIMITRDGGFIIKKCLIHITF